MNHSQQDYIKYQREQFITYLPTKYLYTLSHYWLNEVSEGVWRVGLTKFATRMLGEMVECSFEIKEGDPIKCGQIIGWIEGFKALSDIYSVIDGEFGGENPQLKTNITIVNKDPYGEGFLYTSKGKPDAKCISANDYVEHLDKIITMLSEKLKRQNKEE